MKILNYGSLNIDYTYEVNHIVTPGETLSSNHLEIHAGGKGLNQSVAMARAGAKEVFHAGFIGEDGSWLIDLCKENGIRTEFIQKLPVRTGNAVIQVAQNGENCILLFPGANHGNQKEKVERILENFDAGDFLVLQNELNELEYLIEAGSKKGMFIILNPSPFQEEIKHYGLEKVGMLLINEVEGMQLTGKQEPEEILTVIEEKYPDVQTVLTLGAKGALYSGRGQRRFQASFPVETVDTTAAGDTFAGFLITALAAKENISNALAFAARAAACAVTKKGATESIPYRKQIWLD